MSRAAKLFLLAATLAACVASALIQRHQLTVQQTIAPGALYEVVREQIRAFRSDDFANAYRQVSASFQERFNIEAFSELARTEYPALLRADRVEFGAVRFEGRHALVPVYFFLPDGDVIPCVYVLVNEDSLWKIDVARVLRRWPSGRRLGGMRG